ncbi:MAG: hypothetical protein MUC50_10770 [Myxococcota bacterium]|nr:hypothetical protein [Myxococcota bacterium]
MSLAEEPLAGTETTLDPRALGLSNALRASPSGVSGVYLNPSVIALLPLYHIGLMYGYTGKDEQHMGGVAIVDSVTSVVAAGLAFNYSGINQPSTKHQVYDGRLALAGRLGDVLALGGSLRYLHVEQNLSSRMRGPAGPPALPASGSVQANGFTLDVGACLTLAEVVNIAVVGQNLTAMGTVFAPLSLGGGASVSLFDMWLIELDANFDFTSHDKASAEIQAGTELFIAGQFAVRAGYSYDFFYNMNRLSGGLGYVHQSFGVDMGVASEVQGDPRWQLFAGIKIFIN